MKIYLSLRQDDDGVVLSLRFAASHEDTPLAYGEQQHELSGILHELKNSSRFDPHFGSTRIEDRVLCARFSDCAIEHACHEILSFIVRGNKNFEPVYFFVNPSSRRAEFEVGLREPVGEAIYFLRHFLWMSF